ncbi:MAG: hypothetical protein ACIAQZ_15745 [Sedimentisphaeraceae bacterium JB056]
MKISLTILCAVSFLFLPCILKAAQVSTVVKLEMDGLVDTNTENVNNAETGYVYRTSQYTNDSGSPFTGVTVIADGSGDYPVFDQGAVYLNGGDNLKDQVDEGLMVQVGTGYTPQQSYIWEAWVKPDYTNWPTSSTNQFGWIAIFRWHDTYDSCDDATSTPTAMHLSSSDAFRQRLNVVGNEVWSNEVLDPNDTVAADEFTHVGLVWTYDSVTETGELKYYQNGILKATAEGPVTVSGTIMEFPDTIGVGNVAQTTMDNFDELYCGGEINYNAGYSGWIDSFAFSTFTGTFEGPSEFVLVDPQFCGDIGTTILASDLNADCEVNLLDFAGLATQWLWDVTNN